MRPNDFSLKKVCEGGWVVENAYTGEYVFNAPGPLNPEEGVNGDS